MKAHLAKITALTFLLGVASAHSQTLNWASLTQSEIVDSQGVALDENTFVFELGAFDATFVPDQQNIGQWLDHWHVFDTADYSYDSGSATSYFTATENVQNVANYTTMFQGLQGFLWIRNSSGTEYFLANAAQWLFPTLDPGCCKNGEVTTWSVSNLDDDEPIWGSQGDHHGGGEYDAPGPYDIQTHAVPEAGSSLLALLGCGLVMLRRRRANA